MKDVWIKAAWLMAVVTLSLSISHQAWASKRVALVIGNDRYTALPSLNNARTDARGMDRALQQFGFETVTVFDADLRKLGRALQTFEKQLKDADVGLVFYAGHGIQATGENYLIPVDAELETEGDLRFGGGVALQEIIGAMERANSALNLIILDACRDNPLPKSGRSTADARGLAVSSVPAGLGAQGTAILYSAAPGQIAQDGPAGEHGVFTGHLLSVLQIPGLAVEDVFKQTAARVSKTTAGAQEPWINSSIKGNFYFHGDGTEPQSLNQSEDSPLELALWQSVQESGRKEEYQAYLDQYPSGVFASLARIRLEALNKQFLTIQEMDQVMWVSAASINMRSGPGTDFAVVDRLSQGNQVSVTGKTDQWYRIQRPNGDDGFIFQALLKSEDPDAKSRSDALEKEARIEEGKRQLAALKAAQAEAERIKQEAEEEEQARLAALAIEEAKKIPPIGSFRSLTGPMVKINPGTFQMGDLSGRGGKNARPIHSTTIENTLAVGKYEVTKGQYARFVRETGYNASGNCEAMENGNWRVQKFAGWDDTGFSQTNEHPVTCVSWNDTQAYIRWLNQKTGAEFRLLTEDEWEYAARAGTRTTFSFGTDVAQMCQYENGADKSSNFKRRNDECSDGYDRTMPVGSLRSNAWGLHDMLGNVREFVSSCYTESYLDKISGVEPVSEFACGEFVTRGGSWQGRPDLLRTSIRWKAKPSERVAIFGFRIARTLSDN